MNGGHHRHHPPLPLLLRSAYTSDIRWPHVMYVFVVFRTPYQQLTLFEQSGYLQDLPISPVSATFSENGDHVGPYLSSDCMTHLQETTYPQIASLPLEDTFHRWGGYVPPVETIL